MAKFKYNARTKEGELQTGFVEAANKERASNILAGHDLFILNLEITDKKKWYDKIFLFLNRVKINDLMIFTRQFATLMQSKISLSGSLQNLYNQTKKPILKEAIFEISSDVDSGLSLSQAIERQKNIFSDFYINMVRTAEVTGRLEEAMTFLADYLDKEATWHSRIKGALIYPFIVVLLFLGVAIVMLVTVFPQIAPIFEEVNVDLPFLTQVFLKSGDFMLNWWWAIILILILLFFLIIDYFQSNEGKIVLNELVIKVPVFGNLFKKIYIARFAESASVLIKGGVPVTQAIEISGRAIGNIVYREILGDIAEGVRGGELLSDLLSKNEYYFPLLVGQMVATGEGTGRLDEILSRISFFYTREVNNTLNNLVELIQPILIAVVGVFVGLLFASILLPMYNLVQVF
ncbi:type II secretion system F family protein [Candidatus Wolfebacteria bacterium]|nr:type II secretion system F family protein [Candidatus Wolfebacteria bacterium]